MSVAALLHALPGLVDFRSKYKVPPLNRNMAAANCGLVNQIIWEHAVLNYAR
jgi:hypothetical protein